MDGAAVWRVTDLVRTRCLGGYPSSVIDPTSPKVREAFVPARDPLHITGWLLSFRDSSPSIFEAIVQVLATPRTLKSALRMTLEIWEAMPGEIDFDSVLVASGLRVARPDLFALVSEHIDLVRHGLTNPFSAGDEKREPHAVVARIDELLRREDERAAAALRTLLHFLFPKYPPEQRADEKEYVSRPQAMFVADEADYWRRFLAQTPIAPEVSDQKALASIRAWRDGNGTDLIDRILDPQRGSQIQRFVGQFLPSDLCRLLREVADRLSTQSAAGWENRADAPGVTAVWRMMFIRQPSHDAVYRTVVDIVERTARTHLPLANDVTHFFATSSPNVPVLMSDTQRKDVVQRLRRGVAANFLGEGAEKPLALALREGSPWIIRWIVFGEVREPGALAFDRWPEFSNVLLTLAENQPPIGVPLVVSLVTQSNMSTALGHSASGEPEVQRGWAGQFDEEAARRLFDFGRLVRVLRDFHVPDYLDEQMKATCLAAVDAARAASENS